MKYLSIFIFTLALLIGCKENSEKPSHQSALENLDYKWVEEKIEDVMKTNNIPALSIGIVRGGRLVYSEGFGHLNRDSSTKVGPNTLYQIGSDTKKFTAMVVNNLVMEGELDLDKSIMSYLPDSLPKETRKKLQKISIKMLLNHKSGIPNRAPSNSRIDGDPMLIPYTKGDLLSDLNDLDLDFEPGTKFSYSNLGYAITGYLCERAGNQDYASLVKKLITNKYGMPNTCVFPNAEQKKLIATPYRKDDKTVKSAPWAMGKMTPAGGIYSNVLDISNLMIAQLKAYQKFYETGDKNNPLILTENAETNDEHYGFGLAKRIDENGIRYGHGGDLDGFASGYVFSAEHGTGVVLLTSSGGKWFSSLDGEIRKILFDKVRSKTVNDDAYIEK